MSAETYIGRPCRKCANTIRYVSTKDCVPCRDASREKYRQTHKLIPYGQTPERRAYQKLYRETHKSKNRWHQADPVKQKQYHTKWLNTEKGKATSRRNNLKRKYGINETEYDRLLAKQDKQCAICKIDVTPKRLCVDHDHDNGRIRGLLCRSCNLAIGLLKHNPTSLKNGILYLEKII